MYYFKLKLNKKKKKIMNQNRKKQQQQQHRNQKYKRKRNFLSRTLYYEEWKAKQNRKFNDNMGFLLSILEKDGVVRKLRARIVCPSDCYRHISWCAIDIVVRLVKYLFCAPNHTTYNWFSFDQPRKLRFNLPLYHRLRLCPSLVRVNKLHLIALNRIKILKDRKEK